MAAKKKRRTQRKQTGGVRKGAAPYAARKDEVKAAFGRIIKKLRDDAGWSQQQLALRIYEASGAGGGKPVLPTSGQVADWENGVRGPNLTILLALQRVFGRDFTEALDK